MSTMRRIKHLLIGAIVFLALSSCGTVFEKYVESGKYDKAEELLKKMQGNAKYEYAEHLIREYIELEEYDKAVYVYEKITPEHESGDRIERPYLCHGASGLYESNVTTLFREIFLEVGDYDKVWQYSAYYKSNLCAFHAEDYFKFMGEVIIQLCSKGYKTEAQAFLKHYAFWFYLHIDSNSYYSSEYPSCRYDTVISNLQKIINTY